MLIQIALIAVAAVLAVASIALPEPLTDAGNTFLRGFINQELLATLGVVVTITLASAGSLHIELSKLASRLSIDLDREKAAVRASSYLLILLFVSALALVTLKPIIASVGRPNAFANSAGLLILLWAVSVLYDLTRAAFRIGR